MARLSGMPQLAAMTAPRFPYEWHIGWRYTRAGRGRNGFLSFISGVSMLGIALGVAALIIVLSVMNGFQKEVRDRMLGVVSHIELIDLSGEGVSDPASLMARNGGIPARTRPRWRQPPGPRRPYAVRPPTRGSSRARGARPCRRWRWAFPS